MHCILQEEKVPPKPFAYEYGGVDYNGQAFQKVETQDEYGVVQGAISLSYHNFIGFANYLQCVI